MVNTAEKLSLLKNLHSSKEEQVNKEHKGQAVKSALQKDTIKNTVKTAGYGSSTGWSRQASLWGHVR